MSGPLAWQYTVESSRRFAVSLLLLCTTAAAALIETVMPWPAKLAILVLIIANLAYYLARDVLLRLRGSWRNISLQQRDISVVARDGTSITGKISDKTFVSPYFVVLCIKPEGRRLLSCRVIFPDAVGKEPFRELCIRLRYA